MPIRKAPKGPRRKPSARPAPAVAERPGEPIIVGLGASAGGLAALEQFFRTAPPLLGVAYVVVQHLDPEHASVLTELLQRTTALPVVEVADGMTVRPNVVYVIPPNREMEVFEGSLLLAVPTTPRGHRMAVDGFFRSLADEQGASAVGVVLSGTGSDGALGLRAIHDVGGTCLVQEPDSAKYDGMPAAALDAVPSSLVAPAGDLPALLTRCLGSHPPPPGPQSGLRATDASLRHVLAILRSTTGRDFSQYKRSSIVRRVERRMAANGIGSIDHYARYLRERPAEVTTLFQECLINVTSFFRDPKAFDALQAEVLEKLVEAKGDETIRVWIAGCATGEEAYSTAILLREALARKGSGAKVQLYATDLDQSSIAAARTGVYPAGIAASVSAERLRRFFVREEGGYRIKNEIREDIVFAVQDVIREPPFTRLDLLCCRNLLIYLEPGLQRRILTMFHYALRPGGALFLSPAETIGELGELFVPVDRKWRIFRAQPRKGAARVAYAEGLAWVAPSTGGDLARPAQPSDVAERCRRLLVQYYAPASVVVDREGNILYVHGDTGSYLRPGPGQPTLSIVGMAREGLQRELRAALLKAATRGRPVHRSGVLVNLARGTRSVDLTVRPVAPQKGVPELLLVSFEEADGAPLAKLPRGKARRAGARPTPTASRSWPASSPRRRRACKPPSRSNRPPTRSCSRPTRSCSRPTRRSRPATRSWRPPRRSSSRSTRSSPPSTPRCRPGWSSSPGRRTT